MSLLETDENLNLTKVIMTCTNKIIFFPYRFSLKFQYPT